MLCRSGLGRGKDPAVDPTQDDDRHQQGPPCTQEGLAYRQTPVAIVLAQPVAARVPPDVAYQAAREQDARADPGDKDFPHRRSEEHTSELQSLMRNSYAVFCLNKT